jgi:hypothetical protein
MNFFLIFEPILIGSAGLIYSRPGPSQVIVKILVVFGLVITLIWFPE